MYVIGGIIVAFLALWWATRKIKMHERAKDNLSAAMSRENSELRHVVTEMAKERHHWADDGRGKRSR
jgi:ABC-type nickel/cobalt efflux system permease component RcnA